jgi:hypothetical protein
VFLFSLHLPHHPFPLPHFKRESEGVFFIFFLYYKTIIIYNIYNILSKPADTRGTLTCKGKPVDTRGYHRTLTRKGTVFTGTGMGPGKNTRGLPVSFPSRARFKLSLPTGRDRKYRDSAEARHPRVSGLRSNRSLHRQRVCQVKPTSDKKTLPGDPSLQCRWNPKRSRLHIGSSRTHHPIRETFGTSTVHGNRSRQTESDPRYHLAERAQSRNRLENRQSRDDPLPTSLLHRMQRRSQDGKTEPEKGRSQHQCLPNWSFP